MMAGLLAYAIFITLPIPKIRTVGIYLIKTISGTYSCATARDFHTVPYYSCF